MMQCSEALTNRKLTHFLKCFLFNRMFNNTTSIFQIFIYSLWSDYVFKCPLTSCYYGDDNVLQERFRTEHPENSLLIYNVHEQSGIQCCDVIFTSKYGQ